MTEILTPGLAMLRRELHAEEDLRWWGQPEPMAFARSHLLLTLAGVPLLGIAWLILSASGGDPFGWLFLAGGVAMLCQAPIALLRARAVAYAITDRRVLMLEASPIWGRARSILPAGIGGVDRLESEDGSGDLLFLEVGHRQGGSTYLHFTRTGFFGVPDVRRAELELLRLASRAPYPP